MSRPAGVEFLEQLSRQRSRGPGRLVAVAVRPCAEEDKDLGIATRSRAIRRAAQGKSAPQMRKARSQVNAGRQRPRDPKNAIRDQFGSSGKSVRVPKRHGCVGQRGSAPAHAMDVDVAVPCWEPQRVTVVCCFMTFPVTNRYRPTSVRPSAQGLNLFIDWIAYISYFHTPRNTRKRDSAGTAMRILAQDIRACPHPTGGDHWFSNNC